LRIGVAIATKGRPSEVGDLVAALAQQSVQAEQIVVSAVSPDDVAGLTEGGSLSFVFGSAGLCHQRNRALDRLLDKTDIIVFFDDDYLPSRTALEGCRRVFAESKDVVGLTGRLLADGINSEGVSLATALSAIAAYDAVPDQTVTFQRGLVGLYGCNMAFRTAAIGGDRFDEALPAYAWQEDIDFSYRIGRRGQLVKSNAMVGVHRGVKGARQSGLRFGYSQIVNPAYMFCKGTMPAGFALKRMVKNFCANHVRLLNPEPWVDRKGRAFGNWMAIADLLRGRIDPGKISQLR
jgi:GT2 family glycosyltransferase